MEKYISILSTIIFSFINTPAPEASQQDRTLVQNHDLQAKVIYINVFISADKIIFMETEKIKFEEVEEKTRERVRSLPFHPHQRVVYRIFGDEKLKHGYIMDVSQKMISGYRSHQTLKYLLNITELELDGPSWLQQINMQKLKKLD